MLILVIINSLCENYHLITKIFHLKTPQQRTDVSFKTVPLSAEQRSLSDGGSQTAKQRCCTQCSPQPLMNITCPWRVQRCSNQRAQTGLGIKLAPALRVWSFVSLSLSFFSSQCYYCMKKWMDERYHCNQQNQVCLLSGLTVVPSATQLHSVWPSWPSEASFGRWGAPENTSSTCRYMLIVTQNVSVLTPWIKAYNIHTLKFNAFKQPQTHWHCKRM